MVPAETEVVGGGGIVGACTALSLARRRIPVVLCEKGAVGEEQSSRNWGWVSTMGRDVREKPMMIHAMRLWDGMAAAIGADLGFRRHGIANFCDRDEDMAKYAARLKAMAPFDLDTGFVGRERVRELAPGSTRGFVGGLHTPSDGFAEPHLATRLIAEGARRLGARIVESCAVRGFETAAGRVSEAMTEKGRIRCRAMLPAGGIWSSLFGRNQRVRIPGLRMLSQVMRTRPVAGGPPGCGSGRGFGFRRRLDGGYKLGMRSAHPVDVVPASFRFFRDYIPALKNEWRAMKFRVGRRTVQETLMLGGWVLDRRSPFETYRVMRPEPGHRILDQATMNIKALFPQFRDMVANERMSAWIDVTPDAIPVISPVAAIPGFFVSTGYSGHGFGIAPAAGQLMAELVTGAAPHVDPASFRDGRFFDGSTIVYWPIGF